MKRVLTIDFLAPYPLFSFFSPPPTNKRTKVAAATTIHYCFSKRPLVANFPVYFDTTMKKYIALGVGLLPALVLGLTDGEALEKNLDSVCSFFL